MRNEREKTREGGGKYAVSPLPVRFSEMETKKQPYLSRGYDYAAWTVPYILQEGENGSGDDSGYMDSAWQSLGARCALHLTNKYIGALFPTATPFFQIVVDDKAMEETQAILKRSPSEIQAIFAGMERESNSSAMDDIDARGALFSAFLATIVLGDSLVYLPQRAGESMQTYSFKDYCVSCNPSGEILDLVTVDYRAKHTLGEKVLKEIEAELDHRRGSKEKNESEYLKVYTRARLTSKRGQKRYHVTQSVEDIALKGESWVKPENLPWLHLTWHRVRNESYGRGLVELNQGNFHGLDVLSQALAEGVVAASDIKYLVDPNSGVSVYDLTHSESGSFHFGERDSVTVLDVSRTNVWQFLMERTAHYEREIGMSFLLNSAATRDAERVTAQEIRLQAQELETSHGGVYSGFARALQKPLARFLLKRISFGDLPKTMQMKVVTGMNALGRAAELDNLMQFIQALGVIQTIPDDLRAIFRLRDFVARVAAGFGVPYEEFLKSEDEVAQQQKMDMLRTMLQQGAKDAMGGLGTAIGGSSPEDISKIAGDTANLMNKQINQG